MKKIQFYVCPECGNIITSTGAASISCCGRKLEALQAAKAEEAHTLKVEPVEDEWFISTEHDMTKDHYISFLAFATGDKVLMVKQYPEWAIHLRIKNYGHGKLFSYCTKHGLVYQLI